LTKAVAAEESTSFLIDFTNSIAGWAGGDFASYFVAFTFTVDTAKIMFVLKSLSYTLGSLF